MFRLQSVLRRFECVVSSIACPAGGHRTIYHRHLERFDSKFRKLCRSIVGPPQTHTSPVRVKATVREGHGKLLQPNISIPSTTLQKPSHESFISHIWPPETMMNGKFPVQKIQFDHPSALLGDQFVCEVLHNNSSSTSGRDTSHS